MKRTNKYLSLALAIIMALSLCVTAFAEEGEETADITVVDGWKTNETYKAYKIFDYTANGTAFAYTMHKDSVWKDLVDGYTYGGNDIFKLEASATDPNTLVVTVHKSFNTAAAAADFAKTLTAIPAGAEFVSAENGEFKDLGLGYWFVDTTLGSLCSLINADTEQKLYEKNSVPTISKEVQEVNANTEATSWGESATSDMNKDVKFKLTVAIGNDTNAEESLNGIDANITIVDTIPTGMTFKQDTVNIAGFGENDYSVAVSGQTVTFTLYSSKVSTLGEGASIVIEYDATVTNTVDVEKANTNTATLTYKGQTSSDSATVYTYDIDVFKYTMQEKKEVGLADAKFILKKDVNGTTKYAVTDANYVITGWTTVKTEATPFVSPADGNFKIKGLDKGVYALEEIEAPKGYNLMTGDTTITLDSLTEGDAVKVFKIENKTGTMLPSTGGVGTTMFYVLGSVMMIGAAILLVTKKKMANEQ